MSMSSLFSMHPLSQCCMSILYHRLPLDIDVIEMLCPLSRDEVSAHNIHTLLSEVTWYTEDLAPHELAGKLDMGPQDGTWVLTQPRVLFERGLFW